MTKISTACQNLYKAIKESKTRSPIIADTEWSNTNHDLDLLFRFLERRYLIGK